MSEAMPRIPDYLDHIIEAIKRIRDYATGLDELSFRGDTLVQDAVIRNFVINGEASRKIERESVEFVRDHSAVPWALIYAMRNRFAHGYFNVDLAIVWRTIQTDLPDLDKKIQTIRDSL
jgi:uncharacterized protein with HEPN domain